MKKLILVLMMTIGGHGFAWSAPVPDLIDPVFGDVTMIMKIGGWPGDEVTTAAGKTRSLTVSAETRTCDKYVHCFNPFILVLSNNTGTNVGIGIDYVHKVLKRSRDRFYLAVGVVALQNPLNHDQAKRINMHVGLGVEIDSFVISFDAYSTPDESPGETTFLINTGWHF